MTENELARLHSFIKGYEKLCEQTGVHLIAREQGCIETDFHGADAMVEVEYEAHLSGGAVTTRIGEKYDHRSNQWLS